MRNVLIGTVAVLFAVASAQAAITASVTPQSPAGLLPGLAAYKVSLHSDTAPIQLISDLSITGCIQVQHYQSVPPPPGYVGIAAWDIDWYADAAGLANDTYLLLEPDTTHTPAGTDTAPDIGAPSEAAGTFMQDITVWGDPAYGDLVTGGDVLGAGVGISQDTSNMNVDLDVAYVVIAGAPARLICDAWIAEAGSDPVHIDIDIPEPATMSLLVLGGVAVLARKRR